MRDDEATGGTAATSPNAREQPDDLDDSWFERPDCRKLVEELRSRLRGARIRDGQALDDSWFR